MLERFASQVAVAIANARAHAQERASRSEVEALLAATASLGAQAAPEAVLKTLVQQAAQLVGADRALFVVLRDGHLMIPGSWEQGTWIDDEHEATLHGIAQLVWAERRPYRTRDARLDPNANGAIVERYQIRAQMAAPLLGLMASPLESFLLTTRPETTGSASGMSVF